MSARRPLRSLALALAARRRPVRELLPVLDHFHLALVAAEEHQVQAAILEGFRKVSDQMGSALGKFGLSPVDARGQVFDPTVHEVISAIPSADVEENKVHTQLRRGYRLGELLLRPAQVIVSTGGGDKPADDVPAKEKKEK